MRKRQFKYRPYTMVEILLVLGISLLLVGLGTSAISAMTGKRGLNGAAMIVSSQVNLARSVAVSQNRYVALLTPEPFSQKISSSSSSAPYRVFFCNRMRLCFVKLDSAHAGQFVFTAWIEGYDWIQLPTKTCAHPVFQQDYGTLSGSRPTYNVDLINDVPIFSSGIECTGIVFAPTGRLANYNDVMIQIYTALPNAGGEGRPDMRDLGIKFSDDIQGTSSTKLTSTRLPYRRWCVSINKLTGRTEVTYAQPPEQ